VHQAHRREGTHTPGKTSGHRKGLDDTHASGRDASPSAADGSHDEPGPFESEPEGPGPAEGRTDNKAGG
jgi:hypothetical protein